MKILVVDDERTFTFSADDEVVYARTLFEAREYLFGPHFWNEVWLDFDLGEGERVGTLVDEIEEAYMTEGDKHIAVDFFFIHSMNPVGVDQMYKVLLNCGYHVYIYPASLKFKGNENSWYNTEGKWHYVKGN